MNLHEVLARIESAFDDVTKILAPFTPGAVLASYKAGGDPVTEADLALDRALKKRLLGVDEGWLSEETVDDKTRLLADRVWIVDPLDGTKEFIEGIPQWCVSIAYVVDGEPVAAGIFNPMTNERMLGAIGLGVTYQNKVATCNSLSSLKGAIVLSSRSESKRGEWDAFANLGFTVKATGSVAYKLALVAAGQADATWTLCPKNEWDVAAGVCLVRAAGGKCWLKGGGEREFNQKNPLLPGLLACGTGLAAAVAEVTGESFE